MTTHSTEWGGYLRPFTDPAPATARPAVAPVAAPFQYSEAHTRQLTQLMARPENAALAQGVVESFTGQQPDVQAIARAMDTALGSIINPLGTDAMNATPTGLYVNASLDNLAAQSAAGRTTFGEADVSRAKALVETTIKNMRGRPDSEILQAIGNVVSPELRSVAEAMAEQQLATKDFNLLASTTSQAQVVPVLTLATAEIDTANTANPLAQAAMVQNRVSQQNWMDDELRRRLLAKVDIGPGAPLTSVAMTAPLAFTEAGSNIGSFIDFVADNGPTPGLPNLKGGRSQSGPDFA